jgi:hypothetical protein
VVADVVKQLCDKMDVDNFNEYGVYIRTSHSRHATLLQSSDYVLDTTTILDKKSMQYVLSFQRVLWLTNTEKIRNAIHLSVTFDQMVADVVNGNLLVKSKMTPEYLKVRTS